MVYAIGKWNGSCLFWELTKGSVSFSITDHNLRLVASKHPYYIGNVVRQCHVEDCFEQLAGMSLVGGNL